MSLEYIKHFTNVRAIRDWKVAPPYIKDKVLSKIDELKYIFPQLSIIYLWGSYVNGTYIDERTPTKFKILLNKFEYSDIDLVSPDIDKHHIKPINGVDLFPGNYFDGCPFVLIY